VTLWEWCVAGPWREWRAKWRRRRAEGGTVLMLWRVFRGESFRGER
jgi:hypothetical protein